MKTLITIIGCALVAQVTYAGESLDEHLERIEQQNQRIIILLEDNRSTSRGGYYVDTNDPAYKKAYEEAREQTRKAGFHLKN
jgi:hypothetical protein